MKTGKSQGRKKGPLYRKVYTALKGRILTGECLPGAQIATEPELQKQFGASRITIRQGVKMLVAEGFLDRQQGRGTFVPEAVRSRLRVLCVCGLDFAASHQHHLGSYYADLIVFSQEQAMQNGWELETVWLPTYKSGDRVALYCQGDTLRQYVGFLFLACGSVHPVVRQVEKLKLRHTMISPLHQRPNGVWLDYAQGIELALSVFDGDRKRPLVVMGVGHTWDLVANTLAQTGRKAILVNITVEPKISSFAVAGYERTLELIREGQDLSQLLLLDDNVALGVTRALLASGYRDRPGKIVVLVGKQEVEPLGLPATFVAHDTGEEVRHAFLALREQMRDRRATLPPWASRFELLPPPSVAPEGAGGG
jgi:DNA-binding LacI/PurR family transcriptional regulator